MTDREELKLLLKEAKKIRDENHHAVVMVNVTDKTLVVIRSVQGG